MSVYPHTARALAEEIVQKVFPKEAGPSATAQSRSALVADIELNLNQFACHAADIAGLKDPTKIARHIWYKTDGWEHGGSAISWEEKAEELEEELEEAREALQKAIPILEEHAEEERIFWGEEDKHGIASEAESVLKMVQRIVGEKE